MKNHSQIKPPQKEKNSKKEAAANLSSKNPRGKEAVKKAILDATEKLLLKRNPSEISVREIAKAAKIKHPLIYRHFGTKEKLIMEVHARGISKVNSAIPRVEDIEGNVGIFFEGVRKNKFRQLALARAMIDGTDPHLIQNQFPVMERLLRLLKKRESESKSTGKFSVEFSAASLAALALGWMLYEPFLLAATGMENENKEDIEQKVIEILEEFLKTIC